MGVGPNFVLDKGFLAEGSTAYAFGEVVVPGTVEQSVTRATTGGAQFAFICQEDVDATRVQTGKVFLNARIIGISRAIAGAAIAKGAKLTNDTSARVITQAGIAGSGAPVIGIALTAAANAGDHIDVLLTPGAVV